MSDQQQQFEVTVGETAASTERHRLWGMHCSCGERTGGGGFDWAMGWATRHAEKHLPLAPVVIRDPWRPNGPMPEPVKPTDVRIAEALERIADHMENIDRHGIETWRNRNQGA